MKRYIVYSKIKFIALVLFKALYAAAFVGFALILQWLVNTITADGATADQLFFCVGIAIGYVAVFTAILLLKDKASTAYINKAVMLLRNDLTHSLLHERYEDFASNDTAKYLSHLTNDIKTVAVSGFNSVITLPEEIFTFVFAVAAAFFINYVVALTMLGLTLLIFIVPVVFNKPLNRANVRLSDAVKQYTAALKQTFLGIDVVKNFGSEERTEREIARINETLCKKNTVLDKLNLYAGDVGIFIVVLLQLGSIAIAGYMMLQSVILIGAVIAVVQLSGNMYSPLMQIAGKAALISGIRELDETLLAMAQPPEAQGEKLFGFERGIRVENVGFSYPDHEDLTLKNVSAAFEKGKKYLIVGKSGSGKSTLLKLIGKTFNGYVGKIEIDGVDYKNISERELYKNIAFAQQKSYLFDLTVRENIDFNGTGDAQLLEHAVEIAELRDFVLAQKNGLDEQISEEINQISGGEKQRVGLARAIYKDTDILLLDEVTSSLDKETAYRVEKNILALRDKTVLNVSHKLHADLLEKYDYICVMDGGKIVDFAPPASLLKNNALSQYMDA